MQRKRITRLMVNTARRHYHSPYYLTTKTTPTFFSSKVNTSSRSYSSSTKIKNYYEVLNIPPDSSDYEIRNAFAEHMRETHPNFGGTGEGLTELTEAFSILNHAPRREHYDVMTKIARWEETIIPTLKDEELENLQKYLFNSLRYEQRRGLIYGKDYTCQQNQQGLLEIKRDNYLPMCQEEKKALIKSLENLSLFTGLKDAYVVMPEKENGIHYITSVILSPQASKAIIKSYDPNLLARKEATKPTRKI